MSNDNMLKFITSDYVSPKDSELAWVFIHQPGKPGPNPESKNRLVASLIVPTKSAGCKALKAAIDEFWEEHKPAKTKCKSKGYQPETEKTGEVDADDLPIRKETGNTVFQFWTGTHWPDGSEHDITIYNAKGKPVSLGDKKIGNGSKGAISGTMAIYNNGPSATGVTLYLNAIQLTKFVEFTQDAGFNDLGEDEEEAFEGVESEFEGTASAEDTPAQPRL